MQDFVVGIQTVFLFTICYYLVVILSLNIEEFAESYGEIKALQVPIYRYRESSARSPRERKLLSAVIIRTRNSTPFAQYTGCSCFQKVTNRSRTRKQSPLEPYALIKQFLYNNYITFYIVYTLYYFTYFHSNLHQYYSLFTLQFLFS